MKQAPHGSAYQQAQNAYEGGDIAACQRWDELDDKLWLLERGLIKGRLTEWSFDFARSILRQAKRGGPQWAPSQKQLTIINQLLRDLRRPHAPNNDGDLIDDGDRIGN